MNGFSLDRVADALAAAGLLVERRGALPDRASGLTDDSRAVGPGALFLAVRGSARDGQHRLDVGRVQLPFRSARRRSVRGLFPCRFGYRHTPSSLAPPRCTAHAFLRRPASPMRHILLDTPEPRRRAAAWFNK